MHKADKKHLGKSRKTIENKKVVVEQKQSTQQPVRHQPQQRPQQPVQQQPVQQLQQRKETKYSGDDDF